MTPSEVTREMREYAEHLRHEPLADPLRRWANALEQAIREPFAWWVDHPGWDASRNTLGGYAVRFKPDTDRPGHTVAPLFAFPPDAEEEIRYLRSRLADATKANDVFQTATDTEIKRLQTTLQRLGDKAEQEPVLDSGWVAYVVRAALAKDTPDAAT